MPFVFWNVTDVLVEDFKIIDPPLWSLNIMNGTYLRFNNIYVNATAVNAPYGSNWVQNTDGFGESLVCSFVVWFFLELTKVRYHGR